MSTASEFTFDNNFDVDDNVKKAYDDHGYIIVRGLLDKEEMAQLKKNVDDHNAISENAYGLPDGDGGEGKMVIWSHPGNDVTGIIARSEKVAGFSEKLLGGEVYHYHSKLTMKNPNSGGKFIWHQDYGYWYQNGCLFPDMLSVFIPVDRCVKENGCLEILDGSNRCGRIEHKFREGQHGADMDRVNEIRKLCPHKYVELEPGDALFFSCLLLHTSGSNNSPLRRWVFIPCYNKASNDPVYEHHHPQYTKLYKVPNRTIKECRNYTDVSGKEFIDVKKDKTVKVGSIDKEQKQG
ncbi:L-proline trans-4-hydroxylase-like [Haliotis rubra]|uniref:L-proline trans-4-hydroxylase-like n=1 Tax=Haliotis rubra TaxID=36100 RepID=UPI001EE54442|nr:L-proline trans-4-hydroxylase-like [Haliotis rubra]